MVCIFKNPQETHQQILSCFLCQGDFFHLEIIEMNIRRAAKALTACRLDEWVACLHAAVMATVIMCRFRKPAYNAISSLGKEHYINGYKSAFDALHMALHKLITISKSNISLKNKIKFKI